MIYSEMYLDLIGFFFLRLFTYLTCFCYSIFGGNISLTASQLNRIKALLKWKLLKSKLLSSQIFILCIGSQKSVQKTFSAWAVRWGGHHGIGLVSFSKHWVQVDVLNPFVWSRDVVHLNRNLFVKYSHEICYVIALSSARCHFLSPLLLFFLRN